MNRLVSNSLDVDPKVTDILDSESILGGNGVWVVDYRKVASSNTSCLEAHEGFFRLFMNGILDPYIL